MCRSEHCIGSELSVCVSVIPIRSHRSPFLHGAETGTAFRSALSFSAAQRPGESGPSENPLKQTQRDEAASETAERSSRARPADTRLPLRSYK
jgi:hypothetical protein